MFDEAMNRTCIKSSLLADGARFIIPTGSKGGHSTRLDGLVLMMGTLFVL
jgi:hypothetical protein